MTSIIISFFAGALLALFTIGIAGGNRRRGSVKGFLKYYVVANPTGEVKMYIGLPHRHPFYNFWMPLYMINGKVFSQQLCQLEDFKMYGLDPNLYKHVMWFDNPIDVTPFVNTPAIDTLTKIEGTEYKVKENTDDDCKACDLNRADRYCLTCSLRICTKDVRSDGKNVVFKEMSYL